MGKTDAEGAPTGQELPAELILAFLASGCRVNRTQATAALSELISVGLLACRDGRYSLCRRRQRPRALLLRTDAEVLRTAAFPTPASTYREHPADVGPLLEAADQLQARDESEML